MTRARLDAVDAAWLQMEEPDNLMMITALLTFDGPLDADKLRAVLADRLVGRYPRFSLRIDRPDSGLGRAAWVPDEGFCLADHVSETTLPAPGDVAALRGLVSELLSTRLDLRRSPWQLHLVHGVTAPDGTGPTSALVARLHHSIGDGMALASLLLGITDERDAARGDEDASGGGTSSPLPGGLLGRLALAVRVVAELVRLLASRPDPPNPLRGRLSQTKQVGWTGRLPLQRVKEVAGAADVTVNDVLLAVATGAVRAATVARGLVPVDVRASVPVDLRDQGEAVDVELGNRFGVFFTPMPLSEADPLRRLRAVAAGMSLQKSGAQAVMSLTVLTVLGRVPRLAEKALVRVLGSKTSCVMTNVPGPTEPLSLAGSRLDQILFWVPQAGRVAVGVSVLSYADSVTVGVASDAAVFDDPQQVADAVPGVLAELAAAVGA